MRKYFAFSFFLFCVVFLVASPRALAAEYEYDVLITLDAPCQAFEFYISDPDDVAKFSFIKNNYLLDNYIVLVIENKEVDGKFWICTVAQNNLLGGKQFSIGLLKTNVPLEKVDGFDIGGLTALNRNIQNVDMQVHISIPVDDEIPKLPEVVVPTLEPSPEWWPDLSDEAISEGLSGGGIWGEFFPEKKTPEKPTGSVFTDVDESHWAYDAMALLAEITPLYPKYGKARPADPITRAEFSYLMCLVFGISQTNDGDFFSDVTSETPYSREINALAEIGIVSGVGEGAFEPNGSITREGAVLMIFKIIGKQRSEQSCDLRDMENVSEWAAEAVQNLNICGIIAGDGEHNFNPKIKITRAGAAVLTIKAVIVAAEQFVE
jgi:hypothetical protein